MQMRAQLVEVVEVFARVGRVDRHGDTLERGVDDVGVASVHSRIAREARSL